MEITVSIFAGFILLIIGGEFLVRGASKLANIFGVSPLVIGLTIVAFGTSAPEMFVSIVAGLNGSPEIALANVIGSNIFNICFILGICGIIKPLIVHSQVIRLDGPFLVGLSLLTWFFCHDLRISVIEGFFLAALAIFYTVWIIWFSKKKKSMETPSSERIGEKPSGQSRIVMLNVAVCFLSLFALIWGSEFLVKGATGLAKWIGISETLIGLTVVAMGTSLPEVATSVMATIRGNTDIAIGNLLGSNMFNLMVVLGVSSSISSTGLPVAAELLKFDMPFMVGAAVVLLPMLYTKNKLRRIEAAILIVGFVSYSSFLIVRG